MPKMEGALFNSISLMYSVLKSKLAKSKNDYLTNVGDKTFLSRFYTRTNQLTTATASKPVAIVFPSFAWMG